MPNGKISPNPLCASVWSRTPSSMGRCGPRQARCTSPACRAIAWRHSNNGSSMSSVSTGFGSTRRSSSTPMARAEIDFKSAVTVGEVLSILVTVERLGRSSIVFGVTGQVQERICWEARFVCVFECAHVRLNPRPGSVSFGKSSVTSRQLANWLAHRPLLLGRRGRRNP